MTLQVPFEQFAASAKRVLGVREAFVTRHGSGTLVTASTATARTVVAALTSYTTEDAKNRLKEAGLEPFDGAWSAEGLTDLGENCATEAFVAAIAYVSDDGKPGVWVDAFSELPTPVAAMRAMYDEFRDTGELSEVTFEEFVRLANPNVVVVNPAQIRGYIAQKASRLSSNA